METCEASPELKLFFEKLLSLKAYLKEKAEASSSLEVAAIYLDAYVKLHDLIKEGKL